MKRAMVVVGDVLSDFYFGMRIVEIFLDFQLLLLFLLNWKGRDTKKEVQGTFSLAFCSLFAAAGLSRIFSVVHNYFIPDMSYMIIKWTIFYVGFCLFLIMINRIVLGRVFFKPVYRYSYLLAFVVTNTFLLYMYANYSEGTNLNIIAFPVSLFLFVPFFVDFYYRFREGDAVVRKNMLIFLIGLILMYVGWSDPFKIDAFYLLYFVSIILIAVGANGLPSLSEFDWRWKVVDLYALSADGICFLVYTFKTKSKTNPSKALGLGRIVDVVKEKGRGDQKRHVIRQEKHKFLLLESGTFVTIVLIAKQDLSILHDKMRALLDVTERLYRSVVPRWNGDLNAFQPLEAHVRQIFD